MVDWDNKKTEDLFKAILSLRNTSEAKKFFRDLLTEREIVEFAKRWQTVRMLNDRRPYLEIEKETGLSSTTIARVARWFNKGMGGYKLILKRQDSQHHHSSSPFGKGLC